MKLPETAVKSVKIIEQQLFRKFAVGVVNL